jgi:uncharacterized membrane protein YfcA
MELYYFSSKIYVNVIFNHLLCIVLGLLIIGITIFFAFTQKKKIPIKNTIRNGIAFGTMAGISTGMFNIVGPFLMVYYISISQDNLNFKASLEASFLIAGLYSAILHFLYGNISAVVVPYILISVAASLIAGFIGLWFFKKIKNREAIKKIIYIALPLMALVLLIKSL